MMMIRLARPLIFFFCLKLICFLKHRKYHQIGHLAMVEQQQGLNHDINLIVVSTKISHHYDHQHQMLIQTQE